MLSITYARFGKRESDPRLLAGDQSYYHYTTPDGLGRSCTHVKRLRAACPTVGRRAHAGDQNRTGSFWLTARGAAITLRLLRTIASVLYLNLCFGLSGPKAL